MMEQVNCTYCGSRIDPKWFNCKGCGAPVTKTRPTTPHVQALDMTRNGVVSSQEARETLLSDEYLIALQPIDDVVFDSSMEEFVGSATIVLSVFLGLCFAALLIVLFLL